VRDDEVVHVRVIPGETASSDLNVNIVQILFSSFSHSELAPELSGFSNNLRVVFAGQTIAYTGL
jgi:hypothetical protein